MLLCRIACVCRFVQMSNAEDDKSKTKETESLLEVVSLLGRTVQDARNDLEHAREARPVFTITIDQKAWRQIQREADRMVCQCGCFRRSWCYVLLVFFTAAAVASVFWTWWYRA